MKLPRMGMALALGTLLANPPITQVHPDGGPRVPPRPALLSPQVP